MSTLREIEKVIPLLTPDELKHLSEKLRDYRKPSLRANGESRKVCRSILDLRPLPGRWTGESVIRTSDLAAEMFDPE
jgi:hypothetical protein